MTRPDAVAHAWARYRAQVVPPGASATQIQECQRAFYGGAWALLGLMLPVAAAAPSPDLVEALGRELADFAGMQLDAERREAS